MSNSSPDRKIFNTDLSLIERLGDSRYRTQAWSIFVDRYTRVFYTWFRFWGVESFLAEDLLQETLIRVFNDIHFFEHRETGSFRAWLKTLAHNSWLQLINDSERQLALRSVDQTKINQWDKLCSKLAENHLLQLVDAWATEELLDLAKARVQRRVDPQVWETYDRIALKKEQTPQVATDMDIHVAKVYDRVSYIRKLIRQEMSNITGQPS